MNIASLLEGSLTTVRVALDSMLPAGVVEAEVFCDPTPTCVGEHDTKTRLTAMEQISADVVFMFAPQL
jgi:hypothetical protein